MTQRVAALTRGSAAPSVAVEGPELLRDRVSWRAIERKEEGVAKETLGGQGGVQIFVAEVARSPWGPFFCCKQKG